MMIDHVWTVLCSQAIIDGESNTMSIQNVLEQITIHDEAGEPVSVPVRYDVVSLWVRTDPETPAQGQMRIKFRAPSGVLDEYGGFAMDIDSVHTIPNGS